ncbi:MAG: metallophosphoesterase [Planctomycetes bacterium]|nr:metallophosphoesterase [Planctomycetota bacterium]
MNRRAFLKTAAVALVPGAAATASYGLYEAGWVEIVRKELALARLPRAFDGTRVAFLTDIHHGPFTSLDYIRSVVRTTLSLRPDLILLGGDYSLKDGKYIAPCFDVLAGLTAPMGVYGVLGNHDYWHGLAETKDGFRRARIEELTNRGVWFERGGARFRVCGVDDMWMGKVDMAAALGDATPADTCLVVSHNPDVAEKLRDVRVGLMVSGHTHGGQVVLPGGAPFVPSNYGSKYLHGVCQAPATTVYVSRGLGCTSIPIRFGSRPELTLITLKSA